MTTQVSWRADEELIERARQRARALNQSLNQFVTNVVNAATDPTFAGTDADQLRERLTAAGLLTDQPAPTGPAPNAKLVEAAARRAGRGKSVSEIVIENR